MKASLLLVAVVALLTSCTSVTVRKADKVDLASYHRIFVEQPFNENHHLDEYIVAELQRQGRIASSGPMTMMPDDTDAVLSYDSRWNWDFRTYLIELDVALRTAHTNKRLAEGRYYQPSARTKPAEVVVHDLITRLLAPENTASKKN